MRSLVVLFAGLIGLSSTAIAPANANQGYLMTCVGGGSMTTVVGQRVSNPHVFIEVNFKRGRQGFNNRAPAPGECAWENRGVHGDEPNKLYLADTSTKWTQTVCDSRGCQVKTPSRKITALSQSIQSGRSFQLYVYNDQNGRMIVTHLGGGGDQVRPNVQSLSDFAGNYKITHMSVDRGRLNRLSPEIQAQSNLSIDRQQSVSARLGCNTVQVDYRTQGNATIAPRGAVSITRMGCQQFLHRLDSYLVQALENVRSAARQGNSIVFKDRAGTDILKIQRQ